MALLGPGIGRALQLRQADWSKRTLLLFRRALSSYSTAATLSEHPSSCLMTTLFLTTPLSRSSFVSLAPGLSDNGTDTLIRRTRAYASQLARTIFNNYFDTLIHYSEGGFIAPNVCHAQGCCRSNEALYILSKSMNLRISYFL